MKTRLCVLAVALALASCSRDSGAAAAATHTVTIDSLRFQPEDLTVKSGDTIIWVNKDPFPHTATSKAGGFDSGEVGPGQSWKYVASAKGELAYVCSLHPTMKAILRVK